MYLIPLFMRYFKTRVRNGKNTFNPPLIGSDYILHDATFVTKSLINCDYFTNKIRYLLNVKMCRILNGVFYIRNIRHLCPT